MSEELYDLERQNVETYKSPGPVASAFLRDRENLVRFIRGPFGSGKTNVTIFDAFASAYAMPVCRDGIIRYRHLFFRDTYDNMWRTTLPSWHAWYPQEVGKFTGSQGRQAKHVLKFDTPGGAILEFEAIFMALQDNNLESLLKGTEFTGATMGEADQFTEDVLTYLNGRVLQKRWPAVRQLQDKDITLDKDGNPVPNYYAGVTGDYNPTDTDHWIYETFDEIKPWGHKQYKQPGGRSPQGENRMGVSLEAYEIMARVNAHRPWWVRRNVDGLPGYSRDGKPVYEVYDDERHCAADDLMPVEGLPIRLSFDQGVAGPAMLVSQVMPNGQLRYLDEFVPGRMGPTAFGKRCKILLRERYSGFRVSSATCDLAGFTGGDKEEGDLAWSDTVSQQLGIELQPAPTNEIQIRIDGVAQLLQYFIEPSVPALLISPRCKMLRRGFNSHYRYMKRGKGASATFDKKPQKNVYSNPHDALQYDVLDLFGLDGVMGGAPGGDGEGARIGGVRAVDDDDDLRPRDVVVSSDFDVYEC